MVTGPVVLVGAVEGRRGDAREDTAAGRVEARQTVVADRAGDVRGVADAAEERLAHIQKLTKKRAELKKKLAKLMKEREEFAAAKRKEMAAAAPADTLGDAVNSAVREQLERSGFEIKK